MIRLGCQLGSQWYNLPFKNSINYTKKAGYQGVELTGYYGAWQNDVYSVFGWGPKGKDGFKKYLDKLELQLVSIYLVYDYHDTNSHDRALRGAESACEFLKFCGGHNLVVGTAIWSGGRKRDTSTEEMKNMAHIFNEIGKIARKYDVKASAHPHYDGWIETKEDFAKILDLTNPELVGACPDVGWHYLAGDDPVEVVRAHSKRITHLHLKDSRITGHRGSSPLKVRYWWPLGKGKIDFPGIMKALKEVNYNGWITVETEGSRTPLKDAIESKKYFDDILFKIYR